MQSSKIIDVESKINHSNGWTNSTKFDSEDRNVLHQSGREYKVISKSEIFFSCTQKIKRGFLRTMTMCYSLGLAFIRSIRNIFTKSVETIRFGISLNKNEPIDKKIQSFSICRFCKQPYPCQHVVTYNYDSQKMIFSGLQNVNYGDKFILLGITNEPIDKKIKSLSIAQFCMQSSPCQHGCVVTYIDDQQEKWIFNRVELKKLILELPPENVYFNGRDKEHFVR